jgi:hypothetical protein
MKDGCSLGVLLFPSYFLSGCFIRMPKRRKYAWVIDSASIKLYFGTVISDYFSCELQIAIPIVPTIRVIVTFTKFEELQPLDEFATPPSSPTQFQDAKSKDSEGSASWYSWVRGGRGAQSSDNGDSRSWKDEVDPFHIPSEYTWVDATEKKRRMKAKKAKNRRGTARKQSSKSTSSEGGQRPMMDGFE